MIHFCEKIMYQNNQYERAKLVLVKGFLYPLRIDTIHLRYFVINMNDEIIYLDQFNEKAVVRLASNNTIKVRFSAIKIKFKYKSNLSKKKTGENCNIIFSRKTKYKTKKSIPAWIHLWSTGN